MLDLLQTADTSLFFLFNKTLHFFAFDWIMPVLTEFDNWKIPVFIILFFIGFKYKKKGVIAVCCGIIGVTIADQLSSTFFKPLTGRQRPCFELEGVRLLIGQVKSLSFPSSHAANITATAYVFSFFFKKAKIYLIILATAVSYSRIYVGVHYPSDVIAGVLVGFIAGIIVVETYKYLSTKTDKLKIEEKN